MTKFQKALKQTIKRWENRGLRALGIEDWAIISCGFCRSYGRSAGGSCNECPIDNGVCCMSLSYDKNLDVIFPLAVLVYLHGFEE
jgi:hypothetical protein